QPGAQSPLHGLHELAILATHLVVELDQLPHRLFGDVGAEEVVEEAGAPLGPRRPDGAEREVRLARIDDHLERRPDEVELARRRAGAVLAALAELAEQ